MGRSKSKGAKQRVEAARRQAALTLGRDPDQRDAFVQPSKSGVAPTPKVAASSSPPLEDRAVAVLTIGEAATRLGLGRSELESLIDRGVVKALPTGFTRMVPCTEVERMQAIRRADLQQ